MIKLFAAMLALCLFSPLSFAQDEMIEDVGGLTEQQLCQKWAKDDNISAAEMDAYIQKCLKDFENPEVNVD